jgi:hypothetical protein
VLSTAPIEFDSRLPAVEGIRAVEVAVEGGLQVWLRQQWLCRAKMHPCELSCAYRLFESSSLYGI